MKTRRWKFKTSMSGRFLKASKPKEGKIELTAETDGLLKVDKEKLNAVNGLGQS